MAVDDTAKTPAPKLERVVVTTRYADPESGDPGAARYGWSYVEDGVLHITDAAGNALRGDDDRPVTVTLDDASNARLIAASLTKKRGGSRTTGFERGPCGIRQGAMGASPSSDPSG
jgi:hypothetical protein